jgi:hypothetical protein
MYLPIDTATSGDNTLVTPPAGKQIVVVQYTLIAAGAVSVRWKSGASNNLSGALPLAANSAISADLGGNYPGRQGALATNAGQALVLNLSANVQVSGHIVYEIR